MIYDRYGAMGSEIVKISEILKPSENRSFLGFKYKSSAETSAIGSCVLEVSEWSGGPVDPYFMVYEKGFVEPLLSAQGLLEYIPATKLPVKFWDQVVTLENLSYLEAYTEVQRILRDTKASSPLSKAKDNVKEHVDTMLEEYDLPTEAWFHSLIDEVQTAFGPDSVRLRPNIIPCSMFIDVVTKEAPLHKLFWGAITFRGIEETICVGEVTLMGRLLYSHAGIWKGDDFREGVSFERRVSDPRLSQAIDAWQKKLDKLSELSPEIRAWSAKNS
jgi:hypothetical protein